MSESFCPEGFMCCDGSVQARIKDLLITPGSSCSKFKYIYHFVCFKELSDNWESSTHFALTQDIVGYNSYWLAYYKILEAPFWQAVLEKHTNSKSSVARMTISKVSMIVEGANSIAALGSILASYCMLLSKTLAVSEGGWLDLHSFSLPHSRRMPCTHDFMISGHQDVIPTKYSTPRNHIRVLSPYENSNHQPSEKAKNMGFLCSRLPVGHLLHMQSNQAS